MPTTNEQQLEALKVRVEELETGLHLSKSDLEHAKQLYKIAELGFLGAIDKLQHLESENQRLSKELDLQKRLVLGMCDEETLCENLLQSVGAPQGDSYGVPSVSDGIKWLIKQNQNLKADLSQSIKDLEAREQQVKGFMDLNKQLKAACAVKDEALKKLDSELQRIYNNSDRLLAFDACWEIIEQALSDNSGQYLLEENKRLREALDIYANKNNWIAFAYGWTPIFDVLPWIPAQQALNSQKKGEE